MLSIGHIQKTKQLRNKAIEILKTLKFRSLEDGQPYIEEELVDHFIKCWKLADINMDIQYHLNSSIKARHFLATVWHSSFDLIHEMMACNIHSDGYIETVEGIDFTIIPYLVLELGQDLYVCYLIEREDVTGIAPYIVYYNRYEISSLMQFDCYPEYIDSGWDRAYNL